MKKLVLLVVVLIILLSLFSPCTFASEIEDQKWHFGLGYESGNTTFFTNSENTSSGFMYQSESSINAQTDSYVFNFGFNLTKNLELDFRFNESDSNLIYTNNYNGSFNPDVNFGQPGDSFKNGLTTHIGINRPITVSNSFSGTSKVFYKTQGLQSELIYSLPYKKGGVRFKTILGAYGAKGTALTQIESRNRSSIDGMLLFSSNYNAQVTTYQDNIVVVLDDPTAHQEWSNNIPDCVLDVIDWYNDKNDEWWWTGSRNDITPDDIVVIDEKQNGSIINVTGGNLVIDETNNNQITITPALPVVYDGELIHTNGTVTVTATDGNITIPLDSDVVSIDSETGQITLNTSSGQIPVELTGAIFIPEVPAIQTIKEVTDVRGTYLGLSAEYDIVKNLWLEAGVRHVLDGRVKNTLTVNGVDYVSRDEDPNIDIFDVALKAKFVEGVIMKVGYKKTIMNYSLNNTDYENESSGFSVSVDWQW